jgi:hypothetical protein
VGNGSPTFDTHQLACILDSHTGGIVGSTGSAATTLCTVMRGDTSAAGAGFGEFGTADDCSQPTIGAASSNSSARRVRVIPLIYREV